jgi:hypothetical protein
VRKGVVIIKSLTKPSPKTNGRSVSCGHQAKQTMARAIQRIATTPTAPHTMFIANALSR